MRSFECGNPVSSDYKYAYFFVNRQVKINCLNENDRALWGLSCVAAAILCDSTVSLDEVLKYIWTQYTDPCWYNAGTPSTTLAQR